MLDQGQVGGLMSCCFPIIAHCCIHQRWSPPPNHPLNPLMGSSAPHSKCNVPSLVQVRWRVQAPCVCVRVREGDGILVRVTCKAASCSARNTCQRGVHLLRRWVTCEFAVPPDTQVFKSALSRQSDCANSEMPLWSGHLRSLASSKKHYK